MFRNVDEAAGYLAAMIDGEGSVWFRARGVRGASRAIEVANTEPSIISATSAACDMLGITYRVVAYEKEKTSSWKQVYRLLITGRWNYERVQAVVPIRCDRKRNALAASLAAYVEKPLRPTPDELRRWYWDDRESVQSIASRIDRPATTVTAWMRQAGIPRRSRKEAVTLAYDTGRKRD